MTPLRITAIALALTFGLGLTLAWADGADEIKARTEFMKSNGAAAGALKKAIDASDKAEISKQVAILSANGQKIETMYPKSSSAAAGKTRAKDDIWTNPDAFKEAVMAFKTSTEKLAAADKAGNMDGVKTSFDDMGKACNGCHGKFRGPAN
jgi:cytochrome c556